MLRGLRKGLRLGPKNGTGPRAGTNACPETKKVKVKK